MARRHSLSHAGVRGVFECVPVVAEGRYRTPTQVREALRAGAFAVVVGRAITDPLMLTRTFVDATKEFRR